MIGTHAATKEMVTVQVEVVVLSPVRSRPSQAWKNEGLVSPSCHRGYLDCAYGLVECLETTIVPADFSKLGGRSQPPLISPRDIFASLPARAAGYGYLRDVQGQVLDAWMKRRDTDRDLSIKMNTGTGKTIVGLLILRSALNEAAGPALYVAPDNYLAGQVRKQADRLGLATVDDPESTSYVSGQSIGVVTIHKLINGLSVFGGPASSRPRPLKIGSVVVDDAHASLATTDAQCTVRIPSDHPAYVEIVQQVSWRSGAAEHQRSARHRVRRARCDTPRALLGLGRQVGRRRSRAPCLPL